MKYLLAALLLGTACTDKDENTETTEVEETEEEPVGKAPSQVTTPIAPIMMEMGISTAMMMAVRARQTVKIRNLPIRMSQILLIRST